MSKFKPDTAEMIALGHKKAGLLGIIRKKCLDCCCDQPSEVRLCKVADCVLFPYRFGSNPFWNTDDAGNPRTEEKIGFAKSGQCGKSRSNEGN